MDDKLHKINRVSGIMKLAIEAGFCEADMDLRKCDAAVKFFDLIINNCATAVESAAKGKSDVVEFNTILGGASIIRYYGYSIGQPK